MALRSRVLVAVAAALPLALAAGCSGGTVPGAPDRRRRIELVEAANSVRPRTWV